MEVPLQRLSDQLAHIEREVSAIRRELARLERAPAKGVAPLAAAASDTAMRWADKRLLREKFDQMLAGPAVNMWPIGAAALQQQMAQERLEPNELSQGLIAARDE